MEILFAWWSIGEFMGEFWQEGVSLGVLTFVGICIWKGGRALGSLIRAVFDRVFGDNGIAERVTKAHLDYVERSEKVQTDLSVRLTGHMDSEEAATQKNRRILSYACDVAEDAIEKLGLGEDSVESVRKIREVLGNGIND